MYNADIMAKKAAKKVTGNAGADEIGLDGLFNVLQVDSPPEVEPQNSELNNLMEIGRLITDMSMNPNAIYQIRLGGGRGRCVIELTTGDGMVWFGESPLDALQKVV